MPDPVRAAAPDAVLALMHERRSQGSVPGDRRDHHRLGLVIEGGGMRSAVTAGMLLALEQLGYADVFDGVYGASAGAMNAAYFLARQSLPGVGAYLHHLSGRRFISPLRPLRGVPILDLDYLLSEVCERLCPLEWDRVLRSPCPLVVVATSLEDGRAVYLRDFADRAALARALRASCCVPYVAGRAVRVGHRRLFDAYMSEAIPWRAAHRDGSTHCLVLLSTRRDLARPKPDPMRSLLERATGWLNPSLRPALATHRARHRADMVRLERGRRDGMLTHVVVTSGETVGQLERDASRLLLAAARGAATMSSELGVELAPEAWRATITSADAAKADAAPAP